MIKKFISFLIIYILICSCYLPGVIIDYKLDSIKFNSEKGWNDKIQIIQDDINLKIKGNILKRKYDCGIMLIFEFKPKKPKLVIFQQENISFENENFAIESIELSNKKDNKYYCRILINEKIDLSKQYIFIFWLNNIFNNNYLIEARFD